MDSSPQQSFQKYSSILSGLLLVAFFLGIITFWNKKNLPAPEDLLPEISQEPLQEKIKNPHDFTVEYEDQKFLLSPLYDYELWGLVVSKNNISSFFDAYHDEKSFDTKDFCVIWGRNVQSDDYQDVDFSSRSWTCWWSYKDGVSFSSREISNNHLVTDSQEIREKIETVAIGDQIHIKGSLVNYSPVGKNWQRKTSITRDDTGNTACEVVFVEELEVLQKMFPSWERIWKGVKIFFVFLIFLRIGLFFWESSRMQEESFYRLKNRGNS